METDGFAAHHSLVSVRGMFPGLAFLWWAWRPPGHTWGWWSLEQQQTLQPVQGSSQEAGCCCGDGHHGDSPWVSAEDLSSFCCSLGFHAGGCSQPPGALAALL